MKNKYYVETKRKTVCAGNGGKLSFFVNTMTTYMEVKHSKSLSHESKYSNMPTYLLCWGLLPWKKHQDTCLPRGSQPGFQLQWALKRGLLACQALSSITACSTAEGEQVARGCTFFLSNLSLLPQHILKALDAMWQQPTASQEAAFLGFLMKHCIT